MQVMQEGQTIKHEMYGLGIVTASDQERTQPRPPRKPQQQPAVLKTL